MNIENNKLDEQIRRLLKDLLPLIKNNTFIDGGNFQIRNGHYKTSYLSSKSFEAAVALYSKVKERDKKIKLSFLIDNFSIRDKNFELPERYYEILSKYKIDPKEIVYFKENQLRNRATRMIKAVIKSRKNLKNLLIGNKSIYLSSEFCKIKVAKIHKQYLIPTPLGPLLLAQKLLDIEKNKGMMAINFMNPNSYKVTAGKDILTYQELGGKMAVVNIYIRRKLIILNFGKFPKSACYRTPLKTIPHLLRD